MLKHSDGPLTSTLTLQHHHLLYKLNGLNHILKTFGVQLNVEGKNNEALMWDSLTHLLGLFH